MEIKDIRSLEELKETIGQGTTLILFGAPWFALSLLQKPILRRVASQFQGKASVGSVNVGKHPEIASELDIRSIPTLILFKNNKEIERLVGLQPEDTLSEVLSRFLI
ncbi:MAG: thioredoxin family protein [Desulfatiglandales bacterium]